MKIKVKFLIIRKPSPYWLPKSNFINHIIKLYGNVLEDNDYLVIAEKALSIALGNIYDEALIKSSILGKFFTIIIARILWCRLLSRLLDLSQNIIEVLCKCPIDKLSNHKQLVLKYSKNIYKLLQLFKPVSENGIDTTNLPYEYVSLPLSNALSIAKHIKNAIKKKLNKCVNVMIIDSDLSCRCGFLSNVILTSRESTLPNFLNLGVVSYIICKLFRRRCKLYPTVIAYVGSPLNSCRLLRIAKIACKYMGEGVGSTVLEMARKFRTNITEVSWTMLCSVKHYPVVIIRQVRTF